MFIRQLESEPVGVNAYLQQVVMGLIIIMAILFDMVRKGYIFRKPDEE